MLEADERQQPARPVASPQAVAQALPVPNGEGVQDAQPKVVIDLDGGEGEEFPDTTVDTPPPPDTPAPIEGLDTQLVHDRLPSPPYTPLGSDSNVGSKPNTSNSASPASATVVSEPGLQEVQPVVGPLATLPKTATEPAQGATPHDATPEPFSPYSEVPDIKDTKAPRFRPGEAQISAEAIRQRAKRIFMPRRDGSLKVSQEIFREWKSKGKERKTLEEIFKRCGYNSDTGNEFISVSYYFGTGEYLNLRYLKEILSTSDRHSPVHSAFAFWNGRSNSL